MYEDGKTTRQISKEIDVSKRLMSLRDIGIILREYNNEPEPKPLQSFYDRARDVFKR